VSPPAWQIGRQRPRCLRPLPMSETLARTPQIPIDTRVELKRGVKVACTEDRMTERAPIERISTSGPVRACVIRNNQGLARRHGSSTNVDRNHE
jgi:hypothetical protein